MTVIEARNDYLSKVMKTTIFGMFQANRDAALPEREALILRVALLIALSEKIEESLGRLSSSDTSLFEEAHTILEGAIAAGVAAQKLGIQ